MTPVDRLIEHCGLMSDRALREDFADIVFPEAGDEVARELLAAYYRARTKHPTFQPRSGTANNHRHIVTTWRQQVVSPAVEAPPATCSRCGKVLQGRQRKTCGDRCRKALSRAQKV